MFGMGTGVAPPILPPENPSGSERPLIIEQAPALNQMSVPARASRATRFGAPTGLRSADVMVKPVDLISTGKLNALPRLHTRPIDLVVFQGSHREN